MNTIKKIKVAAASVNQTPMDWEGNTARIKEGIEKGRVSKVQFLCFPELSITGYGCEDAFLIPEVAERAQECLADIVTLTKGMVVAIGLPWWHNHALFNVAAICVNGEVVGCVAKQYLAGDGVHYEPRWFHPWEASEVIETSFKGKIIPLGDFITEVDGVRLAFEICEDAWRAQRPMIDFSRIGVDIIMNLSASHFSFSKNRIRHRFIQEGSRVASCAYVFANLLGNESGRVIFDGSSVICNQGNLVAESKLFSYEEVTLTEAVINTSSNRAHSAAIASRQVDIRPTKEILEVSADLTSYEKDLETQSIEPIDLSKEEEFSHAVALGLFDYMRKSWSNGFVVSLSGGADSSAVASLVYLSIQLGIASIGTEVMRRRLSYIGLVKNPDEWTGQLLKCVYQSSKYSGETTEKSARELALGLGASYQKWNIAPLIAQYQKIVEQGRAETFNWERDDLVLQNIQARVRAPGVWMLANDENALLLATSNRSEASVGYATMDGDTCGGLSPIGGIDKKFLRHWLLWLEKRGTDTIQKIPSLSYVNTLQPTAELRPSSADQTDEGDLMPYEILNAIEYSFIHERKSPQQVIEKMEQLYPQYQGKQLRPWVEKFFKLWSRNQWKRERYAPAFHLDDYSLDPKSSCRFPILSAGFKEELKNLKEWSGAIF